MSQCYLTSISDNLRTINSSKVVGRILKATPTGLAVTGLSKFAKMGDRVLIETRDGERISAIIQSMEKNIINIAPQGNSNGIKLDDRVFLIGQEEIYPHESWLGGVLDASARSMDERRILFGDKKYSLYSSPPQPSRRRGFGPRIETGMRIFNSMIPLSIGQRLGIFAAAGVGKSTLLANLMNSANADVKVIALIGERGREIRHLVENSLEDSTRKRSVVFASTSDQSAFNRKKCIFAAMATAEFFRDQGAHVLFFADSLTRFAEAHREIALASGEKGALQGYPASVSHEIMALCERAGPGQDDQGDITGLFSVLVAGNDFNEPISDILRGVLDGHIVLSRKMAENGVFPAIDILASLSRSLPECATSAQNKIIEQTRALLATYSKSEILIQSGLYEVGVNTKIDFAIKKKPEVEEFLFDRTVPLEHSTVTFEKLQNILSV